MKNLRITTRALEDGSLVQAGAIKVTAHSIETVMPS
jgi:hypothetical protein